MDEIVINGSNGELTLNNNAARTASRARRLIRPAVKRLVIVLLIIAEIEACANACMFIYNDSTARVAAARGKAAVFDLLTASVLPSVASVPVSANEIYKEATRYKGPVLSKSKGTVNGPSGKETYYNLNMSGVVRIMRSMGNTDEYWVREDGVKMLGDYVMVAANLKLHPRGSLVETSLGTAIVCDTGGFAAHNPTQIDVAVTW